MQYYNAPPISQYSIMRHIPRKLHILPYRVNPIKPNG